MDAKQINKERILQILGIPPVMGEHSEMKKTWENEIRQLSTKEMLLQYKNQDWCEEYRYICYNELTNRSDLENCYIELNTENDVTFSNMDIALLNEIEKTISEYSLEKTRSKMTEAECALTNSNIDNKSRRIWEYIKDLCKYRIENDIDLKKENNQDILVKSQFKKTVEKIVDINAHITNIECEIVCVGGISQAIISFDNLGFGNITAVKFNAKGYNSFGDVIPINGNDEFFLIIQDINIPPNMRARNLKANMPHADIRKLELEECQICYDDGMVTSYSGKDNQRFCLEEYTETEMLNALKNRFGDDFYLKPKSFDIGWVCGCGRYNGETNTNCSKCGYDRAEIFKATSEENAELIIQEYKRNEAFKREKEQEEAVQKAKYERRKKIIILFSVALAVVLLVFIIHAGIMSTRETYNSQEAMKTALQGTWSHRSSYDDSVMWQIIIDGNKGITKYRDGDDFSDNIEWNPSKGTFKYMGTTYIVNRGGKSLKNGNYDYTRGGIMYSDSSSSKSTSYKSAYTALKISDVYVSSNSSYTVCTGTITNNGSKTYKYVEVKGAFNSSSGTVLDTDWTYAVGSEGLKPGESKTFRLSVTKNSLINSCSVSILDYD